MFKIPPRPAERQGRQKTTGRGEGKQGKQLQILIGCCLGFTVRLRYPSEILEHNRARRESTLVQHFHGALSWKTKIVSIWKYHQIYCSELDCMNCCKPSKVVKTNRNVRWHWVQSDKVHFCHLFTICSFALLYPYYAALYHYYSQYALWNNFFSNQLSNIKNE